MVVFRRKRQTRADQVRDFAMVALTTALDDGKRTVRSTSSLSGARAVATGAALYTAGRAVVMSGRVIRNRFGEGTRTEEDEARDEAVTYDDEYEEPEAEDQEFEDEEYEEPAAEEEDDFGDEEPSRRRRRSARSVRR